tara:strand:- start:114 stop:386 length:273 start_codon:yes stop_codon:yes gene_type:complete
MKIYSYTVTSEEGERTFWYSSRAAAQKARRDSLRDELDKEKERKSLLDDWEDVGFDDRMDLEPNYVGELAEHNFTTTKRGFLEFLNHTTQ